MPDDFKDFLALLAFWILGWGWIWFLGQVFP